MAKEHRVLSLEELDALHFTPGGEEHMQLAFQFELEPPVVVRPRFTCQRNLDVRTSQCSGDCECPVTRPYHGPIPPPKKIASPEPPRDNVNLPRHYARYKIEPVRFLMENEADPFQFNIVKYAMRWEEKNGVEDLRKMLRYGEMYLKKVLGDPDWWKSSTMSIPGFYP